MTDKLPSLAGAAWLETPAVRRIFGVLNQEGDETRIVGGAVRNALLGRPVGEIDFATTALPEVVIQRADAAGMKTVPTGIEHGTVTLVVGGVGYEVTTLREDIETDGRHAVVRFGRDWQADAERRDFTLNALYVNAAGQLSDPVGGYPDLVASRVRFIGDGDRRIAQDRLRILRFFRFHAEYGKGAPDRAGLAATIRGRLGLSELSAERVGLEMRKLVTAEGAAPMLAEMQNAGILTLVLGGVGYVDAFKGFVDFEALLDSPPAAATRLGILGARIAEDVARLTGNLRLTNTERDRMAAMLDAARGVALTMNLRAARQLLYRAGPEAFRDGVLYAAAWSADASNATWKELYRLPDIWKAPAFPLSGRDALGSGLAPGPAIGTLLRDLEAWWIAEDFAPDEAALRARLQQMSAAAQ